MSQPVFDTEHLPRTYFKMSTPVVLGLVVTLVYNLADTFFIAQTNNTDLVAGVSLCAPVFTALMAFGNIYGQGGSSLISRLIGSGDKEKTRQVSSFCFYVAIATGAVIGGLMLLFRTPLLAVLGAAPETVGYAGDYFTVMALGSPVVVLTFIHSNLVRCEGLSVYSMVGNALGSVVNIILDPILIFGLGMGARGAAIATVIGYITTCVFFLAILGRKSHWLSVDLKLCRITGGQLKQVLGVGVTAAITNLAASVTMVLVNQFLLPYGSDKIAAMGIALKVNMIAQLVLTGFAFGAVPLFGYLYGAGDKEKIKQLISFCLKFLLGLSAAFTVVLFAAAPVLIRLLMEDAAVVSAGTVMLRWQVCGTVFSAVVLLLTVLFQASGKILPAFLMSISRQGVVFVAVLLVFTAAWGYTGVLAAQAAADLLSAALALALYRRAFN